MWIHTFLSILCGIHAYKPSHYHHRIAIWLCSSPTSKFYRRNDAAVFLLRMLLGTFCWEPESIDTYYVLSRDKKNKKTKKKMSVLVDVGVVVVVGRREEPKQYSGDGDALMLVVWWWCWCCKRSLFFLLLLCSLRSPSLVLWVCVCEK